MRMICGTGIIWPCSISIMRLASIKKGNIKGETQETIDGLEAQGKFLRAHNYFMLVRMFGGVPLITEDTPDPDPESNAKSFSS